MTSLQAPEVAAAGPRPARTRRWRLDLVQRFGPPAGLVLLIAVFAVISPQFRTWTNVRSLLDSGAVLAVVAVGLTFVLLLGAIDLSVEGVMAATALAAALLVANNRNGLDLGLLGLLAAVGIGAAFGLLSGTLSTALRIPSFMTTLGVSAIGIGVATVLFAGVQPTVADPAIAALATGQWLGLTPLTVVAAVVVALGLLVQRWTRLGRYAYLIGGAEDLALLSGIRVRRFKTLVLTLAGATYGLAGVMVTVQLGSGIVAAGTGVNFAAITAAVVGGTLLSGGRGGVAQSVIGVLIVTVLANGLVLVGVSPYVQRALQGVIVVAAVAATTWPLRARLRVVK